MEPGKSLNNKFCKTSDRSAFPRYTAFEMAKSRICRLMLAFDELSRIAIRVSSIRHPETLIPSNRRACEDEKSTHHRHYVPGRQLPGRAFARKKIRACLIEKNSVNWSIVIRQSVMQRASVVGIILLPCCSVSSPRQRVCGRSAAVWHAAWET